ncbi:unnamed protein product [Closterium sp. NIES-53]
MEGWSFMTMEAGREDRGGAQGVQEPEVEGKQGTEEMEWEIGDGLGAAVEIALKEVLREHRGNEAPMYHRKRRMSPGDVELCAAKCKELLDKGLIQRSESKYAAATRVAARTDITGDVSAKCMCGDYRGLNKVTVLDRYPMQSVEKIFDKLHGATMFSTLDLRQGFNQIVINELDRKKTAFHGPDGLYEWKLMPFGTRNAPVVFQRTMDIVLRGVPGAACYINNVIVFSASEEEHVKDVHATLEAIREAGLTCHPKKCKFGQNTVQYLGFEVGDGKLGVQEAKVEVLDRVQTPTNRSSLRAVLGFLGYYRRFMPNFSRTAAMLNKLLREEQKWQWGEEEHKALMQLTQAVKTATVLALLSKEFPFVLYTEWSSAGMGAILCQEKDKEEKVVAVASRSCNPAEANYSSYKGEGLEAVWAITHFRVYLQGRPFTLVTDHQPLTWLMMNQGLTGRNARWAMRVQENDFTIKHRPGKNMQHVDGLSRNPALKRPTTCLVAMAQRINQEGERKGKERGAEDVWEDRESDGLTERFVQTLKKGLRAYGEQYQRDWELKLP